MGKKAKTSRKGKKAWRANIATDDIEEYFEKATKDALSGGSLTSVPSDSLFFIDKSNKTDIPPKRKIEKHREKVLRCDSILARNPFVLPIPSSTLKKSKNKRKQVSRAKSETQDSSMVEQDSASGILNMWDEKDEGNMKAKKKPQVSLIPAVEVEPPGCSFNPPLEAHQDSLAQAVAVEMQKIYRNELGPKPVPLTVPGEAVDEVDKFFLDVDEGDDNADEELDTATDMQRPLKTKRVTRVEFNRRVRRKEQIKAEAKTKKKENMSKEIDCLPDIVKEIAKEDEEKHKRHIRRAVAKQERLKSGPPRLGKHKFEPAPQQVLLSEEITGSLRKLKGCCTLARDRFKSLEKRGLLVPRAKSSRH